MLVGGPAPQVVGFYVNEVNGSGPANDSIVKTLTKKLGEDSDYIESQHGAINL
jgi:hypothetical protein